MLFQLDPVGVGEVVPEAEAEALPQALAFQQDLMSTWIREEGEQEVRRQNHNLVLTATEFCGLTWRWRQIWCASHWGFNRNWSWRWRSGRW